jgi:hypothetical protein
MPGCPASIEVVRPCRQPFYMSGKKADDGVGPQPSNGGDNVLNGFFLRLSDRSYRKQFNIR